MLESGLDSMIIPLPESSLDEYSEQASTPIFQRIKDYLVGEIASGRWKEGDLVPSEQALVRHHGRWSEGEALGIALASHASIVGCRGGHATSGR